MDNTVIGRQNIPHNRGIFFFFGFEFRPHSIIPVTWNQYNIYSLTSSTYHSVEGHRWLVNWVTKTHPPSTPVENCHLCTDVPPPSEKIGRRVSSPDFLWGRGNVCTQANVTSKCKNLRNRTGEETRRQTLCDKRDNDFLRQTSPSFEQIVCKSPENMNVKWRSRQNT